MLAGEIFQEKLLKLQTGTWIYEEDTFNDWCDGKFSLLWVCGLPGTGKSFLACRIIEYLQQIRKSDNSTISVAYFFCTPQTQATSNILTRSLIGCIANQIVTQDKLYEEYVSSIDVLLSGHNVSLLWNDLILNFFSKRDVSSQAFIVLYGIDQMESPERQEFLDQLNSLNGSLAGKVSVVLLTDYSIGNDLQRAVGKVGSRIEVLPAKTRADMDEYIKFSIHKELQHIRKSRRVRVAAALSLSNNANGSYIWVNDMIAILGCLVMKDSIERCLAQPPKTWYDAYGSNLERMAVKLGADEVELLNVRDFQFVT